MDDAARFEPMLPGPYGGKVLSRRELRTVKSELADYGIGLVKKGDDILGSDLSKRGAFRYYPAGSGPADVILRRHSTELEALHELTHARQYAGLGAEKYHGLGTYAREKHVFSEIWSNRNRFNADEVRASLNYLKRLRNDFNNGSID